MRNVAWMLTALACLGGCANTTPGWDARFGDATRGIAAAQVIDPAAPGRRVPVAGVDGKAAAGAIKAYATTYGYAVQENKQPAITINTTVGR